MGKSVRTVARRAERSCRTHRASGVRETEAPKCEAPKCEAPGGKAPEHERGSHEVRGGSEWRAQQQTPLAGRQQRGHASSGVVGRPCGGPTATMRNAGSDAGNGSAMCRHTLRDVRSTCPQSSAQAQKDVVNCLLSNAGRADALCWGRRTQYPACEPWTGRGFQRESARHVMIPSGLCRYVSHDLVSWDGCGRNQTVPEPRDHLCRFSTG